MYRFYLDTLIKGKHVTIAEVYMDNVQRRVTRICRALYVIWWFILREGVIKCLGVFELYSEQDVVTRKCYSQRWKGINMYKIFYESFDLHGIWWCFVFVLSVIKCLKWFQATMRTSFCDGQTPVRTYGWTEYRKTKISPHPQGRDIIPNKYISRVYFVHFHLLTSNTFPVYLVHPKAFTLYT